MNLSHLPPGQDGNVVDVITVGLLIIGCQFVYQGFRYQLIDIVNVPDTNGRIVQRWHVQPAGRSTGGLLLNECVVVVNPTFRGMPVTIAQMETWFPNQLQSENDPCNFYQCIFQVTDN